MIMVESMEENERNNGSGRTCADYVEDSERQFNTCWQDVKSRRDLST
jgi:hypothetical protein